MRIPTCAFCVWNGRYHHRCIVDLVGRVLGYMISSSTVLIIYVLLSSLHVCQPWSNKPLRVSIFSLTEDRERLYVYVRTIIDSAPIRDALLCLRGDRLRR